MTYLHNDDIMRNALALLDVREQQRHLEAKAHFLKQNLYQLLMQEGKGYVEILDGEHVLKIKNNLRFTKAFDKDTLSGKVGMDRTELDYAGVSGLVERKRLTAAEVEKYQSENRSEFVSVRKGKASKKVKK